MLSKEEFEELLEEAKEKGGQYVVFEVKDYDGEVYSKLAYDSYENYLLDMNTIGFE